MIIDNSNTFTYSEQSYPYVQDYSTIKWILFVYKTHSLDVNSLDNDLYLSDLIQDPLICVPIHSIYECESKNVQPALIDTRGYSYKANRGQIRLSIKIKASQSNLTNIYKLDSTNWSCYLIDINNTFYYYTGNAPIPIEHFGFNLLEIGAINPLLEADLYLKKNILNKDILTAYTSFSENAFKIITPAVETKSSSDETSTGGKLNGEVLSIGSFIPTELGFCISKTVSLPTISNSTIYTVTPIALGDYSKTLTGLTSDTNYVYRSYIKNKKNVYYGDRQYLQTLE